MEVVAPPASAVAMASRAALMRRKFALLLLIVVPAYAPRYTSENYYPKENDPEEVGLHMKQADEHYRKGGQFAREGDWSNAQKHYRLVTALAPGMVDNYVRLAYALRENGMRTEAMAIAMHGLREKVNPALKDRYDLRSLRGEMLVEDGKVAEAARTSLPAACNPKRQFLLEVQLPEMLPEQREQVRGHGEKTGARAGGVCKEAWGRLET